MFWRQTWQTGKTWKDIRNRCHAERAQHLVQFLSLILVRADSSGGYFFRLKYTYLPFVYRILTFLLADLKQKSNCTYIFLRLFNSTPLLLFAKGLQFCLLPFKFSLAIRHIFKLTALRYKTSGPPKIQSTLSLNSTPYLKIIMSL